MIYYFLYTSTCGRFVWRKMAGSFDSLSPDEVCDFPKDQIPSISDSILNEHKIDGEVFLALTDEYLQEIAPLLGD